MSKANKKANVKKFFLINNDSFLNTYLTSEDCIFNTRETLLFYILLSNLIEISSIKQYFYKQSINKTVLIKDLIKYFKYTHKNIYNFLNNFIEKSKKLKIDNIQVFKDIKLVTNSIYFKLSKNFEKRLLKNKLNLLLPYDYLNLSIDTVYLSILLSSFKRKNIKTRRCNYANKNKNFSIPIKLVYLNNIFNQFTNDKFNNIVLTKDKKDLIRYYSNNFYDCLKELCNSGLVLDTDYKTIDYIIITDKDKKTYKFNMCNSDNTEKDVKLFNKLVINKSCKLQIILKNIDRIYTILKDITQNKK